MSRKKLFFENFVVYGLMNVLNKIIPVLLLPVLTVYLHDTAEFGRFDMYHTMVQFGSNLAILGMYDAMFREYFEREDPVYRARVAATALKIVCVASIALLCCMLFFAADFSQLLFGDQQNTAIVSFASGGLVLTAVQNMLSAPTRMHNQRKIFIFTGVFNAGAYYALAIFLVKRGWGYQGMIYASLLSSALLLLFFTWLNRRYFAFSVWDKTIACELFKVGLPLLPVFLIYWVFNSFDKLMIANLLDLSQLGIYSIGLRVAYVSHFIYAAFAGGWQYFAFSTMKDRDQVQMTSRIFEYLGALSILAFLLSLPFSRMLFQLFFQGDYVEGSKVFPYLFLAPLLLMLFQVAGNQLLVVKKTKCNIFCLLLGLICNITLNYILIKAYGIQGCALATLLGYIVSVCCIAILTQYMKLLQVSKRFFLLFVMLLLLLYAHFIGGKSEIYLWLLTLFSILLLYRYEMKMLWKGLKQGVSKINQRYERKINQRYERQ